MYISGIFIFVSATLQNTRWGLLLFTIYGKTVNNSDLTWLPCGYNRYIRFLQYITIMLPANMADIARLLVLSVDVISHLDILVCEIQSHDVHEVYMFAEGFGRYISECFWKFSFCNTLSVLVIVENNKMVLNNGVTICFISINIWNGTLERNCETRANILDKLHKTDTLQVA